MTLAKLFILRQEIELLWTDMDYHREIRMNGEPATDVISGLITLCFATDRDTDIILRWMTKGNEDNTWNEADKMEEGKVCFYENGFDYPPTKTYEFNNAHLIYFKENFCAECEEPMQTTITISPAIQNYGVEFVKRWNVSWIPHSERMPYQVIENKNTKRYTKAYLTNINGEEISNYKVGDIILLCLKTENRIGDKVTINLNDPKYDFEHNGIPLENDTLKNYLVKDNLEQVKLKVIKQKNN